MAIATYRSEGDRIDYSSAVSAGEVVDLGTFIGIATQAIDSGELGSLAIEGVFAVDKASGSGEAISRGVSIYWDSGNSQATTTASGAVYLGKVVAAAADDETTVDVKINANE